MQDLTLVIPAKNESESLPQVLDELKEYNLKKILVIPKNDYSTRDFNKNFDCKILQQIGEGFGSALIEGINSVDTKYFCIFNADGSFNPIYLKDLKKKVSLGEDFVFCSRYEAGGGSEDDTMLTYIGNKFFTFFCNLLFKLNLTDVFIYICDGVNRSI